MGSARRLVAPHAEPTTMPTYSGGRGPPSSLSTAASAAPMAPVSEALLGMTIGGSLSTGQIMTTHPESRIVGGSMSSSYLRYLTDLAATRRSLLVLANRVRTEGPTRKGMVSGPDWKAPSPRLRDAQPTNGWAG